MTGDLPGTWEQTTEHEEHDDLVDETYRAAEYENERAGLSVVVTHVEQQKDDTGWGYQVLASQEPGPAELEGSAKELGIYDDYDAATDRAREFMSGHSE